MDGGGVVREIKFRAYQPEAKGDLKWWSWQELRESDLNTIFRHPEKYHLMQYTGLKDKNGVEIYEGDIIVGTYKDMGTDTGLVVFKGCGFKVEIPNVGDDELVDWERYSDSIEVIGNIYDNPEMLEVS